MFLVPVKSKNSLRPGGTIQSRADVSRMPELTTESPSGKPDIFKARSFNGSITIEKLTNADSRPSFAVPSRLITGAVFAVEFVLRCDQFVYRFIAKASPSG